MYIIYNADGSIKKINLTDFVQKGNNNVNKIFLAIEGKTSNEWAGTVYCVLPNGEQEGPITLTPSFLELDDITYSGFDWELSDNVTQFEGTLIFSLQARNLGGEKILFTYKGLITINPASIIPDLTKISVVQYNSLRELVLQVTTDAATKQYVQNQIESALGTVEEELEEIDMGIGV